MLKIRPVTLADAPELVKIYAPYVKRTAITFEYEVPTTEEFEGRIEKTLQRFPYLVAEENGQVLAYAYASTYYDRSAYDWACRSISLCERTLSWARTGFSFV